LYLPHVEVIDYEGLCCNYDLQEIDAPALKTVYSFAFSQDISLKIFNAPLLECMDGENIFQDNYLLTDLSLPSLIEVVNDYGCAFVDTNIVSISLGQNLMDAHFLPQISTLKDVSISVNNENVGAYE
jgi:hypothetical protein